MTNNLTWSEMYTVVLTVSLIAGSLVAVLPFLQFTQLNKSLKADELVKPAVAVELLGQGDNNFINFLLSFSTFGYLMSAFLLILFSSGPVDVAVKKVMFLVFSATLMLTFVSMYYLVKATLVVFEIGYAIVRFR